MILNTFTHILCSPWLIQPLNHLQTCCTPLSRTISFLLQNIYDLCSDHSCRAQLLMNVYWLLGMSRILRKLLQELPSKSIKHTFDEYKWLDCKCKLVKQQVLLIQVCRIKEGWECKQLSLPKVRHITSLALCVSCTLGPLRLAMRFGLDNTKRSKISMT